MINLFFKQNRKIFFRMNLKKKLGHVKNFRSRTKVKNKENIVNLYIEVLFDTLKKGGGEGHESKS